MVSAVQPPASFAAAHLLFAQDSSMLLPTPPPYCRPCSCRPQPLRPAPACAPPPCAAACVSSSHYALLLSILLILSQCLGCNLPLPSYVLSVSASGLPPATHASALHCLATPHPFSSDSDGNRVVEITPTGALSVSALTHCSAIYFVSRALRCAVRSRRQRRRRLSCPRPL